MQAGLKDRLRWFNACVSAAVQPYGALALFTMVVWRRTGRWGAGAVGVKRWAQVKTDVRQRGYNCQLSLVRGPRAEREGPEGGGRQ
jgi:hypothetical protein